VCKQVCKRVWPCGDGQCTIFCAVTDPLTLPGLAKLKVVKKSATEARAGINPCTGEKMIFKAKPALEKVRAMPLKYLKNMVN